MKMTIDWLDRRWILQRGPVLVRISHVKGEFV